MFGRRISRSAWLKLIGLAVVVILAIALACAPMAMISIRVDLPPVSAVPRTPTSSEWLAALAWLIGGLAAVYLVLGVPVWLVVRIAMKIIWSQPIADR